MDPFYEHKFKEHDFNFIIWQSISNEFPPHWHEEIEVIYVKQDTFDIKVNNETVHLNEGDILIVGANDVHEFFKNTKNRILLFQFGITLLKHLDADTNAYNKIIKLLNETTIIRKNENKLLSEALLKSIEHMLLEFTYKKDAYKYAVLSKLYEFFYLLLRDEGILKIIGKRKNSKKDDTFFEKINIYISKNYHKNISLDIACEVFDLSKSYFSKKFKDTTGFTFTYYLNMYRIQKAREFLIESNENITDIVFMCGFNSVKTFNRLFKEYMNMSPSSYRKRIFENN